MAVYRIAVEFDVDAFDAEQAQKQAQKVADLLNKQRGRRAWVSRAIKKEFTTEEIKVKNKSTLF